MRASFVSACSLGGFSSMMLWAGAIVFGSINKPDAAVMKLKNSPLNYGIMAGLNTRPRTTYLAAVTNPNEALEPPKTEAK